MTDHWLPDAHSYVIDQERGRHDQVLWSMGEYVAFVLLWRIRDFEIGRVDRCSRCYLSQGAIADTYGQAAQENCPNCFGTSFEGGYRAIIVRPVLWNYTEDAEAQAPRGAVFRATAQFQTTSDFDYFNGDYLFRADNTRWQLRADSPTYAVTGFESQSPSRNVVGQLGTATKEDESSVAYLMPPTAVDLAVYLDVAHAHFPQVFPEIEDIRAALQ